MAYTEVLSAVPTQITVGESVSWTVAFDDHPAGDSWTLIYSFVNSAVLFTVEASADGDDFLVEISTSTSASYTAGAYRWQAHAALGDERVLVGAGALEILPDYAQQSSGYDARSHVKITLDALEAVIEGRASKSLLEHSLDKMQLKHMSHAELMKARDVYAAKYRREQIAAGEIASRKTIKAKFV